jgi:hypothetical protein
MKKLLIALMCLFATLNVNAQFERGDYRYQVKDYLQRNYYSTQYSFCSNGDIYFSDGKDAAVWKFNADAKIYDSYEWFQSSDDDQAMRDALNSNSEYRHESYNVWKRYSYYDNTKVLEIVTFGSVNVTYCSYYTFTKSGAWHFDYRY